MQFREASKNPENAINLVSLPHQGPMRKMYRPGFNHYMNLIPKVDPKRPENEVQEELDVIRNVMRVISQDVKDRLSDLKIPKIPDGGFGRIILSIEDPIIVNDVIKPGAEIVLALWGKGFASPVHGHGAGYIHEDLISGSFDVHLFKMISAEKRQAYYQHTFTQDTPGVFYSDYKQDVGQIPRSELIHNFYTNEFSMSLHFLPEHVRDGNANTFEVVNFSNQIKYPSDINLLKFKPGFEGEWEKTTKEEILNNYQIGDVYLIRSEGVSFLGDHYVIITGGLVEKRHGIRPQDVSILIPDEYQAKIAKSFGLDYRTTFSAYKLISDVDEFYLHYNLRKGQIQQFGDNFYMVL